MVVTTRPSLESLRLLYDKFWGNRHFDTGHTMVIRRDRYDPHCYVATHSNEIDHSLWRVLDLEIDGVFPWEPHCESSRIFLRDAFVELYEEAQEGSNAGQRGRTVTGHPGMGMSSVSYRRSLLFFLANGKQSGKTAFLFYVLVQRILDKKPTLLRYSDDRIIGFNENGVDEFSPSPSSDDEAWLSYPERTWVLVDSNNLEGPYYTEEPSGAILHESRKFFIVYAAHRDNRYSRFSERNNMPLVVIPEWSVDELAIGV
jgi:hypothetical protein